MDFTDLLWKDFLAIAQVFVLGCAGFYILKRGILGQCCLRTVSNLVLEVTLPCFMFTNILLNFDKVRGEGWYMFPLYALAMFALAGAAAYLFTRIGGRIKSRGEFISLVTFQNGGFLPIIIIGSLLPPQAAGKVYVYIFLFTIVFTPVMYAVSEKIFTGKGGVFPRPADFFNVATIVTVLAVVMSLFGFGKTVPDVIFRPLKLIGDSTLPLSMIVVGGIMVVNFSEKTVFQTGFILKAAVLKLLFLPAVVFAVLMVVNLSPDIKYFLFLESLLPPAATLPLLAGKYKGDYIVVGQALFGITLLSMVTIPVLLAAFSVFQAHG